MVRGKRQSERPKKTPADRYVPESRRAWVTTTDDEIVLYINETPDDVDSAKIYNLRQGHQWTIDLTRMTLAEFEAYERFWLLAFRLARPLVIERDRKAHADHEAGIGTDYRLYRRLRVAIGIEGDQREHVEGLHFGPSTFSRRIGDGSGSSGGLRGTGDDVASDESKEESTEDNGSETDIDSSVRKDQLWD